MSDVSQLVRRIHQEFENSEQKLKAFRAEQVEQHHARQDREDQLERIFDQLAGVWQPRLEALAKEFGDRLELTPAVEPGRRQASMKVKSPLATIRLRFSASGNSDVTQLVLAYDLDILPILMEIERHAEVSFPLDEVDPQMVGDWLDDRIVGFVKTYLSLSENEYYLKDQMVEDPIAGIRFPKIKAGATRKRDQDTLYFISEETAREFDQKR
jgi:hypothetical protein